MSDHPDVPRPMRPVEFYILLALAREDLHGYAIIQATEHQSGGSVSLDPGTLYRAIGRLRQAGLLRESEATDDAGDGRRRTYALTARGRQVAAEEARRLAGLVRSASEADLLDEPGIA